MSTPLLKDRRTSNLLNRVREDVVLLRADIGNLLSDTTQRTLPNSAHEIANRAKSQLAAGGFYAAERLRNLGSNPRQSASWVGGALMVGLVIFGAYALSKNHCAAKQAAGLDDNEVENGHS